MPETSGQDDARRALANELALAIIHATGGNPKRAQEAASVILASPLTALRAGPARGAEEMSLKPEVIAAAWGAWRLRHPHGRLGPGPGFCEAIAAAIRALPLPQDDVKEGRDAP